MKKTNTSRLKKLDMSTLECLSVVFLIIGAIGDIIYPVDFSHNLLPIDPANISCPIGHLHTYPNAIHSFRVRYNRISGFSKKKVKGKLCHKFILSTTCEENILWSKTVTYTKQNARITQNECLEAIRKTYDVAETLVEHPPPYCAWSQENTVSLEFITVRDHPVSYDPYSGNFLDVIFPEGKTFDSAHGTIYDSGYWITTDDLNSDEFTQMETGYGLVYFPDTWDPRELLIPEARFWSERFRERDFQRTCRLKFKGREGIRFKNGEWFELEFVEEKDQGYFVWWKNLPPCTGANTRVKVADPYENEHHTVDSLTALMFYDRCQNSLSKLRNSQVLTPLDVSYLSQTYPGMGPAYIITSTGLKTFLTTYELIQRTSMYTNETIGYTSGGKPVKFSNWTRRSDLIHGPNGLILRDGRLIFPAFSEMRSLIEVELTQEISVKELYSLPSINGSNHIITSIDSIHRNPDQMDVLRVVKTGVASVSRWIGSVGAGMVHYFILLGLTIFVFSLCVILYKAVSRRRQNQSRSNGVAMRQLSPRTESPTSRELHDWFV
ncbi:glycoprotein [Yushu rhabdovirus]|uniref:Glycoprotein n=1 Tax=Yushu rhabdovirus TaxID=3071240 RepID=A0AA48XA75_9RHAB|nr:glycoprotein [Rhabdoviridae sp.]QXV86588.1 glycoprotein [Yushu rhabdovirus]